MRSRTIDQNVETGSSDNTAPLRLSQATLRVKLLSLGENTRALLGRVLRRESTWVVTLNWEMVARGELDTGYAALLTEADWIVPDGFPVVMRLRFSGVPEARRASRVAGVDLVASLLREIGRRGNLKIAILGGSGLRASLAGLGFPDYLIALLCEQRVDPSDGEQLRWLTEKLRASDARVVFLALGVPKQDRLARLLRERLPGTCVIGVGGSFDYLGGRKKRAPRWMQAAGLEWLWRLLSEPRHTARRYLLLYPVGFIVFALREIQRIFRGSIRRG